MKGRGGANGAPTPKSVRYLIKKNSNDKIDEGFNDSYLDLASEFMLTMHRSEDLLSYLSINSSKGYVKRRT